MDRKTVRYSFLHKIRRLLIGFIRLLAPLELLNTVELSLCICVCVCVSGVVGAETTVATSNGQTFQITGTSVGGKVVTTKLPLPANSKIVTVNMPTSQGGMV